jgi:hypothetical protein
MKPLLPWSALRIRSWVMSEPPAGADRAQRGEPPANDRDRPSGAPQAPERYGPLRVLRSAKSDGRALILYNRDAPSDA